MVSPYGSQGAATPDHAPRETWSWDLPPLVGKGGQIECHRRLPVASRARLVLDVVPGERPLRAEFGWPGHLLPPLATPELQAVAAVHAEDALRRWVPDLGVERVDILEWQGRRGVLGLWIRGDLHRLEIRQRAGDGGHVEHPEGEAEKEVAP